MLLPRLLLPELEQSLRVFPAVLLEGPRQVGKSTLVRTLEPHRPYVTLDDLETLARARRDPDAFLKSLPIPVTLDEVQRVPDLMISVKATIDRDRRPGCFLLTGSANLSLLRKARETLAGRAALLRACPLTASELSGRAWSPLDQLDACRTAEDVIAAFPGPSGAVGDRVLAGGFPEPAHALAPSDRSRWFDAYRDVYLSRDLPELVSVDHLRDFMRLLSLCAASTAQVPNLSHLARDVQVSVDTVRRWINVLEATYLVERIAPYWRSSRSRLVRSPKIHFVDSALAAHLLGVGDWEVAGRRGLDGALLETWVHAQLRAFATATTKRTGLFHFRIQGGPEADLVLEREGRLIPIEVKKSAGIRPGDTEGLRAFMKTAGPEAPFGILLYGGESAAPAGPGLAALPLRAFLEGP